MDICLINPPIQDFYITAVRRQPLGLLYLASSLVKDGHRVALINGHSPKKHRIPVPSEFNYLDEFMNHPDVLFRFPFKGYYHFGLSFQEIKRQILDTRADIFFISALFTTYYQEVEEIIRIVKDCHPDTPIAIGGYHASLYPEYYLQDQGILAVINGEAEETAPALVKAIENRSGLTGIPNLVYLENGVIKRTPRTFIKDIDRIPLPARGLLKKRDFRMYRKQGVSLVSSRGCPHSCSFCSAKSVWGKEYRVRSSESVMEEIDHCVKEYKTEIFNFEDDNLFLVPQRSINLLESLIHYQERENISLDLVAMNGISIEHVDNDILHAMKKAGFSEINLSLVSYSENLQSDLRRPFHSERFGKIVDTAKKLDMHVRAYYILGLPQQDKREIEETISFLKRCGVMMFPSVYYNVMTPRDQWKMQRGSAFYNVSPRLGRQDLVRYFNMTCATLVRMGGTP